MAFRTKLRVNLVNLFCTECKETFMDVESFESHRHPMDDWHRQIGHYFPQNTRDEGGVQDKKPNANKIRQINDENAPELNHGNWMNGPKRARPSTSAPPPILELTPANIMDLEDFLHCKRCFQTFYVLPDLLAHFKSCTVRMDSTFTEFKTMMHQPHGMKSQTVNESNNIPSQSDNDIYFDLNSPDLMDNLNYQDMENPSLFIPFDSNLDYLEGEPQFPCPFPSCRKSFSNRKYQQKHFRMVHGEKRHKCPVPGCTYAAVKPSIVNSHIQKRHPDSKLAASLPSSHNKKSDKAFGDKNEERKYDCSFCGRSMGSIHDLQRHERIHQGIKPYECAFCQKRYFDNNSLRKHVSRLHAGQPGVNTRDPTTYQGAGTAII